MASFIQPGWSILAQVRYAPLRRISPATLEDFLWAVLIVGVSVLLMWCLQAFLLRASIAMHNRYYGEDSPHAIRQTSFGQGFAISATATFAAGAIMAIIAGVVYYVNLQEKDPLEPVLRAMTRINGPVGALVYALVVALHLPISFVRSFVLVLVQTAILVGFAFVTLQVMIFLVPDLKGYLR
ncbi:MAG: hypothetical protein WD768_16985 [Phycisphaeraceae bacterium]